MKRVKSGTQVQGKLLNGSGIGMALRHKKEIRRRWPKSVEDR